MSQNVTVEVPSSIASVKVSIIDSTARLRLIPFSYFTGPDLQGFEKFSCAAYSFLITHIDTATGKERKVVFDLGPPKDWQNDLPGFLADGIKQWNADLQQTHNVSEVLEQNNVDLNSIEAVIWSHAHWDHIGRPSLFPSSTTLITGPGVKEAYAPGFPARPDAIVRQIEFEGRRVEELDFTKSDLTIGSFRAIDFFGDGSFYFLSAPGHAIGHVNGLARTTAGEDSTFILMGADSYHHGSQIRPNKHTHLPSSVDLPELQPFPCPGEVLHAVHPASPVRFATIPAQYQEHYRNEASQDGGKPDPDSLPFFTIVESADGKTLAHDLVAARQTIRTLQAFDADERFLLVAAHDMSLFEILEFFPKGANDWKSKGWKEKGRWKFLQDFKKAIEVAERGK